MDGSTLVDIAAAKQDIMASLHCVLPGTVESFDAEKQTAVIRLISLLSRPSEARGEISLPLLYDVPVFMPVPFEVNPGDACLVVFADRGIDAWLTGGEEKPPGRMHSLSDGFAFVGWKITR